MVKSFVWFVAVLGMLCVVEHAMGDEPVVGDVIVCDKDPANAAACLESITDPCPTAIPTCNWLAPIHGNEPAKCSCQ